LLKDSPLELQDHQAIKKNVPSDFYHRETNEIKKTKSMSHITFSIQEWVYILDQHTHKTYH
jgi:hypothetical protein